MESLSWNSLVLSKFGVRSFLDFVVTLENWHLKFYVLLKNEKPINIMNYQKRILPNIWKKDY